MAKLELPFGVKVVNPESVDAYYSNDGIPYVDETTAVAAVPAGVRYLGLTVNIAGVEWWWKNGLLDGDLIVKSSGSDAHHQHSQQTASAAWNIAHNLGKNPSVTVTNSADVEVIGDIEYVDLNNLTITFTSAFSGKAYCN